MSESLTNTVLELVSNLVVHSSIICVYIDPTVIVGMLVMIGIISNSPTFVVLCQASYGY